MKVPKGFHKLSLVKKTRTGVMVVEPSLVVSDRVGGRLVVYLVRGNYTWGHKRFRTLVGANRYASKLAKKHHLKVNLLT